VAPFLSRVGGGKKSSLNKGDGVKLEGEIVTSFLVKRGVEEEKQEKGKV